MRGERQAEAMYPIKIKNRWLFFEPLNLNDPNWPGDQLAPLLHLR